MSDVNWQKMLDDLTAKNGGRDTLDELNVGHVLILARLDMMDKRLTVMGKNDQAHSAGIENNSQRLARVEAREEKKSSKATALGAGSGTGGGIFAVILAKLLGL